MPAPKRFVHAYLVTALWAETDESRPDGGDPLDDNYTVDDIAEESQKLANEQCDRFWAIHGKDILTADGVPCGPDFDEVGRAGHDFWLTRNGHGCGFWDGDWPKELGERMTETSKLFGEANCYVGDDGKVYIDGESYGPNNSWRNRTAPLLQERVQHG